MRQVASASFPLEWRNVVGINSFEAPPVLNRDNPLVRTAEGVDLERIRHQEFTSSVGNELMEERRLLCAWVVFHLLQKLQAQTFWKGVRDRWPQLYACIFEESEQETVCMSHDADLMTLNRDGCSFQRHALIHGLRGTGLAWPAGPEWEIERVAEK